MLPENHCILDIETDGLSQTNNRIILAGILTQDGIKQFADNDEKELITKTLHALRPVVHTYNGDRFDLPFLRERAKHYALSFPAVRSKDHYVFLQERKKLFNLQKLNRKDLETKAHITRQSTLTGKEIAEKYQSDKKIDAAQLHNREELYTLKQLLPFFEAQRKRLKLTNIPAEIESYSIQKDFAHVRIKSDYYQKIPLIRENAFCRLRWENRTIHLVIPIHRGTYMDNELIAAVSPLPIPNSSPYPLKKPLIVLEDCDMLFTEHLKDLCDLLIPTKNSLSEERE